MVPIRGYITENFIGNQWGNLLHSEKQFVSADAGYQGTAQREDLAKVDVD
jgi:transposase, IS5 family